MTENTKRGGDYKTIDRSFNLVREPGALETLFSNSGALLTASLFVSLAIVLEWYYIGLAFKHLSYEMPRIIYLMIAAAFTLVFTWEIARLGFMAFSLVGLGQKTANTRLAQDLQAFQPVINIFYYSSLVVLAAILVALSVGVLLGFFADNFLPMIVFSFDLLMSVILLVAFKHESKTKL